jgi:hypothetical protein
MAVSDERMDLAGKQVDSGQQAQRAMALVLVIPHKSHVDAGFGRQIRRRRCESPDSRCQSAFKYCRPNKRTCRFTQQLERGQFLWPSSADGAIRFHRHSLAICRPELTGDLAFDISGLTVLSCGSRWM